jgi:hypothetical protein
MPSVFWFSKLKPGARADEYERWVQETDYRLAQQLTCLAHYRVHRLAGTVEGGGPPPYDYIEVLDVTDIDAYRAAMKNHPALLQIISEIGRYIEGVGGAWGETIVPLGKERQMA